MNRTILPFALIFLGLQFHGVSAGELGVKRWSNRFNPSTGTLALETPKKPLQFHGVSAGDLGVKRWSNSFNPSTGTLALETPKKPASVQTPEGNSSEFVAVKELYRTTGPREEPSVLIEHNIISCEGDDCEEPGDLNDPSKTSESLNWERSPDGDSEIRAEEHKTSESLDRERENGKIDAERAQSSIGDFSCPQKGNSEERTGNSEGLEDRETSGEEDAKSDDSEISKSSNGESDEETYQSEPEERAVHVPPPPPPPPASRGSATSATNNSDQTNVRGGLMEQIRQGFTTPSPGSSATSSTNNSDQTNVRGGPMEQLRQGFTTPSPGSSATSATNNPDQADARGGLTEQIRQEFTLKKTSDLKNANNASKPKTINKVMEDGLANLVSGNLNYSQEESVSGEESNSGEEFDWSEYLNSDVKGKNFQKPRETQKSEIQKPRETQKSEIYLLIKDSMDKRRPAYSSDDEDNSSDDEGKDNQSNWYEKNGENEAGPTPCSEERTDGYQDDSDNNDSGGDNGGSDGDNKDSVDGDNGGNESGGGDSAYGDVRDDDNGGGDGGNSVKTDEPH